MGVALGVKSAVVLAGVLGAAAAALRRVASSFPKHLSHTRSSSVLWMWGRSSRLDECASQTMPPHFLQWCFLVKIPNEVLQTRQLLLC